VAIPAPESADGEVYAGFRLQDRSLVPVGNPSREDWLRCLDHLVTIERHVHFWLGDLLAFVFSCWKTFRPMAEVVRRFFTLANVLVWEKNSWGVGDLEGAYGDQQELVLFATRGHRPLYGLPQSNVLPFSRVGTNQMQHPTQKPVDLLAYLIARSSHERGLVVDPFMGSGSTCIAARNTRRRYLGVELDEQWYAVAQRRLADPNEEG
jgi:site-specific DNA-methyltransferase (adenine-specific)